MLEAMQGEHRSSAAGAGRPDVRLTRPATIWGIPSVLDRRPDAPGSLPGMAITTAGQRARVKLTSAAFTGVFGLLQPQPPLIGVVTTVSGPTITVNMGNGSPDCWSRP